ncbi:Rap1a/Tai family immunity protein [Paracoccus yeei]|uniref:Rap1a/Tai family immunity protein n=1 Tax=Paracoccus yeei TaxID=147645 RepID=UPI0011C49631|nr:Rap1a/Tai family immunity protein [Paracoccus yeei]
MRLILSVAFVFATLGAPATAFDGSDLLQMCEQPELSHQRGVCNGFVLGVSSGIELGSLKAGYAAGLPEDQWDSMKRYGQTVAGYCEPEAVKNGQLIDVVVKFLKESPEHRHENAAILVAMAFTSAFPCP